MDPCLFCCTASANTRRSAVKIEVDDAYPSAPSLSTSDSESSRESTPSLPSVTNIDEEEEEEFEEEEGYDSSADEAEIGIKGVVSLQEGQRLTLTFPQKIYRPDVSDERSLTEEKIIAVHGPAVSACVKTGFRLRRA